MCNYCSRLGSKCYDELLVYSNLCIFAVVYIIMFKLIVLVLNRTLLELAKDGMNLLDFMLWNSVSVRSCVKLL